MWSLGITLIELAQGRFPYQDDNSESEMMGEAEDTIIPNATLSQRPPPGINGPMGLSILDLLQFIVNEPSRRLVTTRYITVPQAATVFVDACLKKNPEERKSPKALLVSGGGSGESSILELG